MVIDILKWLMILSAWWLICIIWKIDCLFIQDYALSYHSNIKCNHGMKALTLPKVKSDWFKASSYTRCSMEKWVTVKGQADWPSPLSHGPISLTQWLTHCLFVTLVCTDPCSATCYLCNLEQVIKLHCLSFFIYRMLYYSSFMKMRRKASPTSWSCHEVSSDSVCAP